MTNAAKLYHNPDGAHFGGGEEFALISGQLCLNSIEDSDVWLWMVKLYALVQWYRWMLVPRCAAFLCAYFDLSAIKFIAQ